MLLFLLGLMLLSWSGCTKRYNAQGDDDMAIQKKTKSLETDLSPEWILPDELTAFILLVTVSGFSGTINEEPVLSFKLVAKSWQNIIRSSQFQGAIRILPNIGLWIVQKNLAKNMPVPIEALKAAIHLPDQECWNSVLLHAHCTDTLEVLTRMAGWTTVTSKWQKTIYKEIISNRIMMVVPFFDALQQFWNLEEFVSEFFSIFDSFHGSPYDCHVLFNIPQHELIKLLIVDNLAQLGEDSFLKQYIVDEVLHIYHNRKRDCALVTSWLSGLKNVTLPFSRRDLLLDLFRFPMAVAVLAQSRDFVNFIMGDSFELPKNDLKAAALLFGPANPLEDDADYLKLLDQNLTDEILLKDSIDWMGFSKNSIRLNLERLELLLGPHAYVRLVLMII